MGIKVIATQRGIYGKRERYPGDVFTINSMTDFSQRWMSTSLAPAAAVKAPAPKTPEAKTSEKAPEKVIEKGKAAGKGKAPDPADIGSAPAPTATPDTGSEPPTGDANVL